MKTIRSLLLCSILVLNLLPVYAPSVQADPPPTRPAPRQLRAQVVQDGPGGIPQDADPKPQALAQSVTPRRSPLWRAMAEFPYNSHVYTHSDLLVFGYEDGTELQVWDSGGNPVWSGTVGNGDHAALTPGLGVYLIAGSKPFSVVVGDQLTQYVWGYYAVDQYGHGLSTLLHTYQADWHDDAYDPHFIVFAYKNNTHVTITDSTYGNTIWSGTLDAGEHYDNTSIDGQYLTVSADRPVAALSYTDQGYFVPAENSTFAGRTFHTFVGNSGEWPEFLHITAYENTSVTVTDSDTGGYIWSGTLEAGEVHTVPGLNGRFVTVETSNLAVVSVHPDPYGTAGGYYHSLYAQDPTGTGIGTHFVLPTISDGNLVFFAYDDDSRVTIWDDSDTIVYDGTLSQGDWDYITTSQTIYTIRSSGRISVILDWGDQAGADFAPVHYATLQVDVLTPNGDTYRHGDTMLVAAHVTQLSQGVKDAAVAGRIEVTGPSDVLRFELNDDGLSGDETAGDAIYSAEVPLPDPATMPDGNYWVYVTAQKTELDGSISSGTDISNFTQSGELDQAPSVDVNVTGPSATAIYAGDDINIAATVDYVDGVDRPATAVTARITRPDKTQIDLPLSYVSPGLWAGDYTCASGGRYLIDVRADPPSETAYAAGYGSATIDALSSHAALELTADPPSGPYGRGDTVWLGVTVRADGIPTERANVFAEISPGDIILPLGNDGGGHYVTTYYADTPGTYEATIYAQVAFYTSNQTHVSFTVADASGPFVDTVDRFGDVTKQDMNALRSTASQAAQDGDWFLEQVPGDIMATAFDIVLGGFRVFKDADKVLKSVATDGLIRGYTPGLDNLRLIKAETGIDGRAFESWASRTTHAMRESLLDPHFTGQLYPEWLGPDVFKRALVAYGAKGLAMSVDELAQQSPEVVADHVANALVGQPLHEGMYNSLSEDVDEYEQRITELTTSTLTEMPSMTAEDEQAYEWDLNRRMMAGLHISSAAATRNVMLSWARDVRESEKGLVKALVKTLLHQALRLLVGVLTDGPGVLVVDAVWTGIELYQDIKDLKEDVQMWNFAAQSLCRIWESESRLYTNAVGGLIQVKHALEPRTAEGAILSIDEISRRSFCWKAVCEQEVVSEITIRNTGSDTARFKPQACYYGTRKWGLEFFSHCIEGVRQDGDPVMWITLDPLEEETIELVFKDENGNDVRPPDGTLINYHLFANNDSGTFYADGDSQPLEPEPEMLRGLFSASPSTLAAASTQAEGPVIPHLIYSAPMARGDSADQYVYLEAVNGYGFPINATVVQPLPTGVEVSVPGGGYVEDGQITWRTVIQPHEAFTAEFSVSLPGVPTDSVTMPPAELQFYLAQEGGMLSFYSSPIELAKCLPLRAEAEMPNRLARNTTVPVNVTNWGQATESGALTLTLHDQQGNPLRSDTQAVELCARCSQVYTPTVPVYAAGVYALELTLTNKGYSETVGTSLVSYEPLNRIYLPTVLRASRSVSPEGLIANGDFENGRPPDPWVEYSSGGYHLVYEGVGYGGSWGAWLGGYDDGWDYMEQSFVVPAGVETAALSFHWGMVSEDSSSVPYDTFVVTLRDSSGSRLQTLFTANNTDTRDVWLGETIPVYLSPYAGQTLRLRLEAETDYSLETSFFADDITLMSGEQASTRAQGPIEPLDPPKGDR